MTEEAEVRSTRESGFHPRTSRLTRDFRDVRGFSLPGSYADGGAVEDYWACRERLAVADLSALRKFEVLAPDESLIGSLDNRSSGDLSSVVSFTAAVPGVHFARINRSFSTAKPSVRFSKNGVFTALLCSPWG